MRIRLGLAAIAVSLALGSAAARAEYPERPITFIVPFAPGGTTDIGVRTWIPYVEKCLGGSIAVVNRPGAGGEVGFTELAGLKPDGYTLGGLNIPNVIVGSISKENPRFTPASFTYLGTLYGSKVTINTGKDAAHDTLPKLIEATKSGPVNLGITNFGSDDHLMMLRLAKASGSNFRFIPFSDAATVRNAVMSGDLQVGGLSLTEVTPFQGELTTLAIASAERDPSLPDVPTFREQGFDLVGGSNHAIGGPKGMPADVVAKLDGCIQKTAGDPEFVAAAQKRALVLNPMTAAETEAWVAKETEALQALWKSDPWK
ncbi:tripartite tricarboxylate transporter substrate binding protein [Propylenella binzhouense]|nr:tripartite tricarboxylate transporter substrate binding protein [Propylenella binzhouense]